MITRLLEEGLYPYTKRYLGSFTNHFSTIGLVGMNEALLNAVWMNGDLTSASGRKFAKEVLQHMRERLSDYQEEYGDLYNLEATPAESTTYRFAKHDTEEFPDIITAAKEGQAPYYTNSTHLPVGFSDDIFDALEMEDELQTMYTSGTVFHGFLGERLTDWKSAQVLVRKIAENFRLPYYTLSPTYSVCPVHGYLAGESFTCPVCGKETEVYSRITGYYRPVRNWNEGKVSEFKNRKTYEKWEIDSSEERKQLFPLLLTSRTCPNCKVAKKLLSEAYFAFRSVLAEEEEGAALARKYGVASVPTLFVPKADGYQIYQGIAGVQVFLREQRRPRNLSVTGCLTNTSRLFRHRDDPYACFFEF